MSCLLCLVLRLELAPDHHRNVCLDIYLIVYFL